MQHKFSSIFKLCPLVTCHIFQTLFPILVHNYWLCPFNNSWFTNKIIHGRDKHQLQLAEINPFSLYHYLVANCSSIFDQTSSKSTSVHKFKADVLCLSFCLNFYPFIVYIFLSISFSELNIPVLVISTPYILLIYRKSNMI